MQSRRDVRKLDVTDKYVLAELKNRMEKVRLQKKENMYDKQRQRSAYRIDKSQRQAASAHAKMAVTSGISLHGVALSGPHDRSCVSSSYFHGQSALLEKRLQRWRATERALQRTIFQDEELVLKKPWEKDPHENVVEAFHSMLRQSGHAGEDEIVSGRALLHQLVASQRSDVCSIIRLVSEPTIRPVTVPVNMIRSTPSTERKGLTTAKVGRLSRFPNEKQGTLHELSTIAEQTTTSGSDKCASQTSASENPKRNPTHDISKSYRIPSLLTAAEDEHIPAAIASITSCPPSSNNDTKPNSDHSKSPHSEDSSCQPKSGLTASADESKINIATLKVGVSTKDLGQAVISRRRALPVPGHHIADESGEAAGASGSLPKWKRDLLVEAPPGLHSSGPEARVAVAMSKSERRRQLNRLVINHANDVKLLASNERRRKQEARSRLLLTLRQVEQTIELEKTLKYQGVFLGNM